MPRKLTHALLFVVACVAASPSFAYPQSREDAIIEGLHGQKIADPYRWLENPDAVDTKARVEEQNKVTFGWLDKLPVRAALKQRHTDLWNYERFSPFFTQGKGKHRRYFWRVVLPIARFVQGTFQG